MKNKLITIVTVIAAMLLAHVVGWANPPTPQQALEYAKSVIRVKRVLKDNQVHSYVKEIWRFDPAAGTPPAIGSEYEAPMPYNPNTMHPERDGIIFRFGADRPEGLPIGWGVQVMENGMVLPFRMYVESLRSAVAKTKQKQSPAGPDSSMQH